MSDEKKKGEVYSIPRLVAAETKEMGVAVVDFVDDQLEQIPRDVVRVCGIVLFGACAIMNPILTGVGYVGAKVGTSMLRGHLAKNEKQRLERLQFLHGQAKKNREHRAERKRSTKKPQPESPIPEGTDPVAATTPIS